MFASLTPGSTPGNIRRTMGGVTPSGAADPHDLSRASDSFAEELTPALRDHRSGESLRQLLGSITGGIAGAGLSMLAEPLALPDTWAHDLMPLAGTAGGAALGLAASRQGAGDRFVRHIEGPAQAAAYKTELPPGGAMVWDAYRDADDEQPATGGAVFNHASQALQHKEASWGQTLAVIGGGVAGGMIGGHLGGQVGEHFAPTLGFSEDAGKHLGEYALGLPLANASAAVTGAALRPDIARKITPQSLPAIAAGVYDPGAEGDKERALLAGTPPRFVASKTSGLLDDEHKSASMVLRYKCERTTRT